MRLFVATTAIWLSTLTQAEAATISVGAVTKYSGIATNFQDVADIKAINQNLNSLEAQLAQEFIKIGDVDYLDRMNTDALFRELHLSQSAAFNASSGALRGLLGRLDFLVVIDSAEPTTARIRLIDVESGAVKALETCRRRSSFLGLGQESTPDCLRPFASQAKNVAHLKMQTKIERERHQAIQIQAAQEHAARQQQEARERAAKDQQEAQVKAEAIALEREKASQFAQDRLEAQAREQADLDKKVSALRPDLNDATARLSAANGFWDGLDKELAQSGQSLRSTIRAALSSANLDGRRCQDLLSRRNIEEAKSCISKLYADLNALDALK
jgi:hypothetical protein